MIVGHVFEGEAPPMVGFAGFAGPVVEPTFDEAQRIRAELAERESRRRPVGFAPWPVRVLHGPCRDCQGCDDPRCGCVSCRGRCAL